MAATDISQPAILLVDDEPEILFSFKLLLESSGLTNVVALQDSRGLLSFLAGNDVNVIVLDLQMPHVSGQELLREINASYPHILVIVMTAAAEIETAVDCMSMGAFDYLVKPVDSSRFLARIKKAMELNALRREISTLRDSLNYGSVLNEGAFSAIRTRSPRMRTVFGYLEGVAPSSQPVLITGETGAGKELVARALHQLSGRKGEYVTVNIAGLDDLLLADTLFGHKKGAFTGAVQSREGMVAKAAGGTLFLDEIGELSLSSQVKLLRLLQDGEYHPIGTDHAAFSTARIIIATNRDLRAMSVQGAFRKDLYFRICAHEVRIPPLRERTEDIPVLLEFFLAEAARDFGKKQPTYPFELISYLSAYHFPGNIRELRAMVYDAISRHKGGVLSMAAFRDAIGKEIHEENSLPGHASVAAQLMNLWGRFPTFKEMDECLVEEALKLSGGNQGAAAALLGISRQALNRRLCPK